MKRLIVVTVLLLGSLFALPFSTHPAHASGTGLVCLTRATSNNCPQVPLTFNATAVGKAFTIGVFVQGSDAMGGFDVFVQSDPAFLNPISAALGTLIASPSLTSICVNGTPTTGSCTVGSPQGPGFVEVTTIESSGGNECGGISPCSGMAFTITYQVVGATPSTPLSFPIHPSCSNSSVPNPPNVCVLVADAGGTTLPETTLAGDFTDQTPTANFAATPTSGFAPLTVSFDATLSNATAGHFITLYNWEFENSQTANLTSATTSHTYNTPGTYHPNLETVDSGLGKSSIKNGLTITVQSVGQPDFSIGGNTTSLSILQGANRNVTIILASLNGFSGTVTLSANSSVVLGITSTLNKTSVTPPASGTPDTSAKLTIATAVVTPLGRYVINVTGVNGILKHSVLIRAAVVSGDYSLSNSGPITAIKGMSGTNTITATLTTGTGQPVTLSCFAPTLPPGVSCSFAPATITPSLAGRTSVLTITTTLSSSANSYPVKVTGDPLGPHTLNSTVTLLVSDFQISANPQSVSVPQGGNGNSVITLTGQSGLNSNINLTATSGSGNIIGFLNRTSVIVTVAGVSNSSTLYIIAVTGTAHGSYSILVTGSVGLLTHSLTLTVDVPVPNFGASATPTSVSVKTGTNGTSVLSLTGLNGFTGTISLQATVPTGVGITSLFSSTSVTITSGPVASTLTISTSTTTAPGTYIVTVNATTLILYHLVNITLIVISPLPSVELGSATLSTVSVTAGGTVDMTVTVSNTGTIPVNVTITMDVNSGSGANVTVAQTTVTLNPGVSAQTIKISWNTTQWAGGTYHVYARIIGSQTSAVNQATSAGTVALSSPPPTPPPADLSVIPWITTGLAAAIAVVLGLLLLRSRRPTGLPESA